MKLLEELSLVLRTRGAVADMWVSLGLRRVIPTQPPNVAILAIAPAGYDLVLAHSALRHHGTGPSRTAVA
jgi:hypothetical protein